MDRPRAFPAEPGLLFALLPWIVCLPALLLPAPSQAADIEVSFQEITVLDGRGLARTEFLPGEEMQVRVRLRILRSTEGSFDLRLRIAGDGWYEPSDRTDKRFFQPLAGTGPRTVTFGGLLAAGRAGEGKVSLLVDAFSPGRSTALFGRRHAYLTIRCPEGLPSGIAEDGRFQVGGSPWDMALTADRRYLYVTSQADNKVTVIDAEDKEVVEEIESNDLETTIFLPAGVAPSPDGLEMFVVDGQTIHVFDAATHALEETIPLNPTGELGVLYLGDLAASRLRNEAYVTASGRGILVLDLASREVRPISLLGLPPLGLSPIQVLPDPEIPRFIYVLCGGSSEVVKLDVVTGAIVDFVGLRNLTDLSSLWPVWSMALNPVTDEIYVVANPGGTEEEDPTLETKIYVLPKNDLGGPGRREFRVGTSVWELVVWEDGRYAYGIDSYRGEILVIDMATQTELYRCAIPVEPGGRHLRADFDRNRLFVGGWLAGFADIVE